MNDKRTRIHHQAESVRVPSCDQEQQSMREEEEEDEVLVEVAKEMGAPRRE